MSHEECDRLGMHVANVEALRRAVALLDLPPAYVLTDGFPVDGLGVPGLAVWKGDRVAACISAASVLAKVTRDRIMTELDARLAGVRLQDAQGLHHRGAQRGADRARAVARCTGCGSSTCGGPPGSNRWTVCRMSMRSALEQGRRAWRKRGERSVSAEDLEKYETEMELTLYREYRDVVGIFKYVVETDRRFYLCNQVDVKARSEAGEVFFEVSMSDAWVWDMYRPARFAKTVKVLTFKDVNVEELNQAEIDPPKAP